MAKRKKAKKVTRVKSGREKPRNIKTAKSARGGKAAPKRTGNYGVKYSKAERKEILAYAKKNGVQATVKKHKVTGPSIYRWRKERKAA